MLMTARTPEEAQEKILGFLRERDVNVVLFDGFTGALLVAARKTWLNQFSHRDDLSLAGQLLGFEWGDARVAVSTTASDATGRIDGVKRAFFGTNDVEADSNYRFAWTFDDERKIKADCTKAVRYLSALFDFHARILA